MNKELTLAINLQPGDKFQKKDDKRLLVFEVIKRNKGEVLAQQGSLIMPDVVPGDEEVYKIISDGTNS